jgi:phosphoribosylformylglycinamidine (FGAM) synthase-like amidotransferase family enzyme
MGQTHVVTGGFGYSDTLGRKYASEMRRRRQCDVAYAPP